jgi:arginyl-tRNA synthetase
MENPFVLAFARQAAALAGMEQAEALGMISAPPDPGMGDYAFPCFVSARALRRKPNEIAADLASRFQPDEFIASARAVGPYLNVFVRSECFLEWVLKKVHEEQSRFGASEEGAGKTVVVEFSSPNIAKHPSFHNVRTTMIGHAIANIYSALGYRVARITYLGDWGTQFGVLIAAYKKWGGEETMEGDAVANLNALYVRYNQEAEKDPALREEARAWFKKLEDGDAEAVALWKRFREVSLAAFEEIYRVLGVTFDEVSGESLYDRRMPATIRRLEESGLAVVDQGALIVDLSDQKMPPVILRKTDGATLYHTRDIAAAEDRWERYRFHRMIYVVGQEQRLHFRQLFAVLKMMGHAWAEDCLHVDFGLVRLRGEEGALKMGTRAGRVILLKDVLREVVARARAAIEAKNPALPNKEEIAAAVGVGAVIFNDLKRQRVKDVDFDWDAILSFEGETGPYVQYAHVRLRGILRKYGKPVSEKIDFALLSEPEELALAKALSEFGTAIRRAAEACEPSVVSQYLLDLCGRFSNYYHKHMVVGEDPALTAARVLLVDAVRRTVANGLALLGIAAPEEM